MVIEFTAAGGSAGVAVEEFAGDWTTAGCGEELWVTDDSGCAGDWLNGSPEASNKVNSKRMVSLLQPIEPYLIGAFSTKKLRIARLERLRCVICRTGCPVLHSFEGLHMGERVVVESARGGASPTFLARITPGLELP
jgi:hypothetical protein